MLSVFCWYLRLGFTQGDEALQLVQSCFGQGCRERHVKFCSSEKLLNHDMLCWERTVADRCITYHYSKGSRRKGLYRGVFSSLALPLKFSNGVPWFVLVWFLTAKPFLTWGQKAVYIRRNLPMVERVLKILKMIVISPHDSIKCQSWGGFEKITFHHYTHPWVGANKPDLFGAITFKKFIATLFSKKIDFDQPSKNALF